MHLAFSSKDTNPMGRQTLDYIHTRFSETNQNVSTKLHCSVNVFLKNHCAVVTSLNPRRTAPDGVLASNE